MIEQILKVLDRAYIPMVHEDAMQRAVGASLREAGIEHTAEFSLDKQSRIDFHLPPNVGIECKVGGSAGAVQRQLLRYALTGRYEHLILITSKAIELPPSFAVTEDRTCTLHLINVNLRNLP